MTHMESLGFEAVAAVEGVATADGRRLSVGSVSWPTTVRQIPVFDASGQRVGMITAVVRRPEDDGTATILVSGQFDSSPAASILVSRIREGVALNVRLTGVKLDLPEDDDELTDVLVGERDVVISFGRFAGADLSDRAAFGQGNLTLTTSV